MIEPAITGNCIVLSKYAVEMSLGSTATPSQESFVEPPRPELGSLDVPLSPGQLVWKVTHVSHARGRSQVLDTNGPYIIVERDHTHYVLLTREGKIYDFLVPAH